MVHAEIVTVKAPTPCYTNYTFKSTGESLQHWSRNYCLLNSQGSQKIIVLYSLEHYYLIEVAKQFYRVSWRKGTAEVSEELWTVVFNHNIVHHTRLKPSTEQGTLTAVAFTSMNTRDKWLLNCGFNWEPWNWNYKLVPGIGSFAAYCSVLID